MKYIIEDQKHLKDRFKRFTLTIGKICFCSLRASKFFSINRIFLISSCLFRSFDDYEYGYDDNNYIMIENENVSSSEKQKFVPVSNDDKHLMVLASYANIQVSVNTNTIRIVSSIST